MFRWMWTRGHDFYHRHRLLHRGCNEIDNLEHLFSITPESPTRIVDYMWDIDANQKNKQGEGQGGTKKKER